MMTPSRTLKKQTTEFPKSQCKCRAKNGSYTNSFGIRPSILLGEQKFFVFSLALFFFISKAVSQINSGLQFCSFTPSIFFPILSVWLLFMS